MTHPVLCGGVGIYIYIYIYIYVCVCVCVCVCVKVCGRVCVCVCLCLYILIGMFYKIWSTRIWGSFFFINHFFCSRMRCHKGEWKLVNNYLKSLMLRPKYVYFWLSLVKRFLQNLTLCHILSVRKVGKYIYTYIYATYVRTHKRHMHIDAQILRLYAHIYIDAPKYVHPEGKELILSHNMFVPLLLILKCNNAYASRNNRVYMTSKYIYIYIYIYACNKICIGECEHKLNVYVWIIMYNSIKSVFVT